MKMKSAALIVLVFLLAAGLAACGSTTTTSTTATTAAPSAPETTVTSAASNARTSINIGMTSSQSEAIDPTLFASNLQMSGNIGETLIDFDANSKMQPMLATSWDIASDGKTITFHLRDGVKFSDGSPLTAADVVFSWNRALKNSPAMQDATKGILDHYAATDDKTFVLYLVKPNVNILYHVCDRMFIVSKAAFDKMGEDGFTKAPVATGPYMVTKFQPTVSADLAANPYYWENKPQVQKAHFVYSADPNTRTAQLQSGEVDLVTDIPWTAVPTLKSGGFNQTLVTAPHAEGLQFGCKNPKDPWYNVKVRQAINYAIDKDATINQLFNGVPTKAEWQLPYQIGNRADRVASYPLDLDKAKSLMAEAGYANGFDMPVYYSPEATGMQDMADALVASLKQININVKLNSLTFGPQWFNFMRKLGTDPTQSGVLLWELGGPGGNDPTADLFNQFYSARGALYSTPEIDALIVQAFQTFDSTQRGTIVGQAFDKISDAMPVVLELQEMYVFMSKANVSYTKSDGISSPGGILKGITIK
jgi:peptide/nickel transport system substrate-binding protein